MNELQLGLIGAGAAIVVGVVVYNGLQGRRARRRLPRTMPERAETHTMSTPEPQDEHPFIQPSSPRRKTNTTDTADSVNATTAYAWSSGTAAVPVSPTSPNADVPAPSDGLATGAIRTSPATAAPLTGNDETRREPRFGGVDELTAPADLPAGAAAAEWAAGTSPMPVPDPTAAKGPSDDPLTPTVDGAGAVRPAGTVPNGHSAGVQEPSWTDGVSHAGGFGLSQDSTGPGREGDVLRDDLPVAAAHDASHIGTDDAEPRFDTTASLPSEPDPQSPTTTVSNLPPVVVDRRIDCIIVLELGEPAGGDRVMPLTVRFRRAGNKPVYVEGRNEEGHWGTLRPSGQYKELRAAVQLANRAGPLNELEFSEFVGGVHRLADTLDAAAEFPDMTEVVQMARELDGFAAQCDAQLSVNVLSDGAPWSGSYVQAVASQDGLLLSRDGTRFVKLDAQQNPVFTLTFEGTNFLRDDLTYKGGHMITLLLDVPVADEDILPWRLMCDYARSLAQRIGARVVDDQQRMLPEASLQAIDERLMALYGRLETAGIPAGSPAARRLFSS